MTAPFSGREVAGVIGALSSLVFVLGGIALILAGPCRFASRALLLGLTLAIMAGTTGEFFR